METFDHFEGPETGFAEQAYWFELAGEDEARNTLAMLRNPAGDRAALLRFSLLDFPCFTLWKNTAGRADGYVAGLEPGTSYPNPRSFERENGRVIRLAGGESRTTRLVVETLETSDAVKAAESEISGIQKRVEATRHSRPILRFSPDGSTPDGE